MRIVPRAVASRLRRLAHAAGAAAALVVCVAQPAHALNDPPPVATLRFDQGGALAFTSPWGPADVGRLRGTFLSLPGQPNANLLADLFCIDVLHNVSFDPGGWDVYLTNLGGDASLDYTRQGARYAASDPNSLTRYRKAAWLVDQFATVTSAVDTAGIQGAMWLQFEASLTPYTFANAQEASAVATWQSAADLFAGSAGWAAYDWSRFTVVTDVNSAGLGNDWRGLQELIMARPFDTTVTPEPATFALLGAGLALLGVAARRGRAAPAPRGEG
jgi:hypothetical protein